MRIDLASGYDTDRPTLTTDDPDEVEKVLDAERDRAIGLGQPILAFVIMDSARPRGGAAMEVGLNGDRGFSLYSDPKLEGQRRTSWETTGSREGDDVRYFYSDGNYDDAVVEASAEIPYEHLKAAVLEFMTTGQRPACVEWRSYVRRRG